MQFFEGMRQIAAGKHWRLEPPDPGMLDTTTTVTLEGAEDGIPVRFECVSNLHQYRTTASFKPSLPWHFVITHQGVLGDLANLLGFQDIELGDPDFDKRFRVVSREVEKTRALLTPDVQTQLKRLDDAAKGFGSRFEVTEHAVCFTRGILTVSLNTEESVLRELPAVLAVVRALQAAVAAAR